MIRFEYSSSESKPLNWGNLEKLLKEQHKHLLEKFPNEEIVFVWENKKWNIKSKIDLGNFML